MITKPAKIQAYEAIKKDLKKMHRRIYEALEEPRAINHIRHFIQARYGSMYAYSTVTARLSELEGKGIIYKTSERVNRQSLFVRTRPDLIEDARKVVEFDRYRAWLREGEKYRHMMGDYFARSFDRELKK